MSDRIRTILFVGSGMLLYSLLCATLLYAMHKYDTAEPVRTPPPDFTLMTSFDRPRVYAFARSCGERCTVSVFDATFCKMNAPLHTVTCQFPEERIGDVFPDGMTDRMPYFMYHHEEGK